MVEWVDSNRFSLCFDSEVSGPPCTRSDKVPSSPHRSTTLDFRGFSSSPPGRLAGVGSPICPAPSPGEREAGATGGATTAWARAAKTGTRPFHAGGNPRLAEVRRDRDSRRREPSGRRLRLRPRPGPELPGLGRGVTAAGSPGPAGPASRLGACAVGIAGQRPLAVVGSTCRFRPSGHQLDEKRRDS